VENLSVNVLIADYKKKTQMKLRRFQFGTGKAKDAGKEGRVNRQAEEKRATGAMCALGGIRINFGKRRSVGGFTVTLYDFGKAKLGRR